MCTLTSCEIFEVLEPQPQQSLSDVTAVQNAKDAESALTGVYSALQADAYYFRMQPIYGPLLSGYMSSTTSTTRNITFQSETNSVQPGDNTLSNSWRDIYRMANRASNVIDKVGALSDKAGFVGSRKNEILGEARFLRALAHFDALRFFGQFWDPSSSLGIPLRLVPGDAINAQLKRSTVAEVYASINEDLDFAIANAPSFGQSFLVSAEAAKALKARVALYEGKYAEAAQLADEVIGSGVFSLENNYADIFVNRLNSPELVFGVFASQVEGSGHTFFLLAPSSPLGQGRYDYAPSQAYLDLMDGDPRSEASFGFAPEGPEVRKYPNLTIGDDPTYVIRLAELYLIKAEALARSGGTIADARTALNVVRARAGVEPSQAQTAEELLAEIQLEKVKELAFEGSHEWFDAIRFGNIRQIKTTVLSENQFVLPIPSDEVDPNNELDQNPGY